MVQVVVRFAVSSHFVRSGDLEGCRGHRRIYVMSQECKDHKALMAF